MVTLKDLQSYSAFSEIVTAKSSEFVNSMLTGQPLAVNPAANLSVYWSYDDLIVPSERDMVKKFYDMLGLSVKTKFANLYTDSTGQYNKNNVWLPSISRNPDTQKLALYVGLTPVPIEYDAESGEFLIAAYVEGSATPVMVPLDVQVKTVKTMTGKEIKRATLSLFLDDDGTDTYFEFPIRLVDNESDSLAKAMLGRKPNHFKQVEKLIQTDVQLSKIDGGFNICDINKLLLPLFEANKFKQEWSIIPFTGWIVKNEGMKYPKIHLSVSTQILVDNYGDYKVLGFGKDEIFISKIKKVSINPTASSAAYFINNTPKADEYVEVSGIIIVTGPNAKGIGNAPNYMVQPASNLTPDLCLKFGLKTTMGTLRDNRAANVLQPAPVKPATPVQTDSQLTYADLDF